MIIAEVGLNHLGDPAYAIEYVDTINGSSADAATFQVREDEFYRNEQYSHCRLSHDVYSRISECLTRHGKALGIALCDREEIPFFESIGVGFYKLLYKDIKNDPLVDRLLSTNKLLCVSTGTCSAGDIREFLDKHHAHRQQICLIHTQMSHDIDKVNLRAIEALRGTFGQPVGFGNHCSNLNVLSMAMTFAPDHVFFYVKGCRAVIHPDNEHAVDLADLRRFSENLKLLPAALGDGHKTGMKLEIRGMA
jgi:sialic acid synthase SpsE